MLKSGTSLIFYSADQADHSIVKASFENETKWHWVLNTPDRESVGKHYLRMMKIMGTQILSLKSLKPPIKILEFPPRVLSPRASDRKSTWLRRVGLFAVALALRRGQPSLQSLQILRI